MRSCNQRGRPRATLRRIARDLDSTEFALTLASPSARAVRRMAVARLSDAMFQGVAKAAERTKQRGVKLVLPRRKAPTAATNADGEPLDVRFLGRLETFNADFAKLLGLLGYRAANASSLEHINQS